MLALAWVAALALCGLAALLTGIPTITWGIGASCLVMMWHCHRESGDVLDLRAGFFLAVLLFLAIPDLVLGAELGRYGTAWRSDAIPNLAITREDFVWVQFVVGVGLAATIIAILLGPRARRVAIEPEPPRTGRSVWAVYFGALGVSSAVMFLQYGGPVQMLLFAIDPVRRLEDASSQGSGISGIFIMVLAVSAYYAARRLSRPWFGLALFVPPLFFVLPLANRGTVLQILLIALTAATGLRVKHPFRVMAIGALLLPPLAGVLVVARNNAFGLGTASWGPFALYKGFADDSLMIPMLGVALRALRSGVIQYTYGLDLLMFPAWYVPRSLWPSKPMPLDFRLNAALGLNSGIPFGTPVGIFGGVYLNFTWVAYLPVLMAFALALGWAFRRFRRDRLVLLLLFVFVADITRVGDISRELVTLSLGLVAVWLVRRLTALVDGAPVRGATPVLA